MLEIGGRGCPVGHAVMKSTRGPSDSAPGTMVICSEYAGAAGTCEQPGEPGMRSVLVS